MSTSMSSQGVVLATAMAAAVSAGTVILIAISHQKLFSPTHFLGLSAKMIVPRSCISSSDGKKKRKTKKRVQFAKDVVEPSGNSEDFRKRHNMIINSSMEKNCVANKNRGIPANRMALYNGMLRDRVGHRLAYSC